jgi:hypothetical protein
LVVTPYSYLVFYEVTENEIVIHNIRHSSRNPATTPSPTRPRFALEYAAIPREPSIVGVGVAQQALEILLA